MHPNELKALHVSEVLKQAEALEIENTGRMRKQELMFAIIKKRAKAKPNKPKVYLAASPKYALRTFKPPKLNYKPPWLISNGQRLT